MQMEVRKLTVGYGAAWVLDQVSLQIGAGEFVGIVGCTGCGKTTLLKAMAGLLEVQDGEILLDGENIFSRRFDRTVLRRKVGMVFQYPEYQLFETTVLKDAAYGPQNQGFSENEALEKAKEALIRVKLPEKYWEMSPFELSGGQKRRAAIAGVIAMNPKVLILDEPTAGLDPAGRDKILNCIENLHKKKGMAVVLVSHSMEDVANYAERIIVMNNGSVMFDDTPKKVFKHYKELEKIGLAAPQITYIMHMSKIIHISS